MIGVIVKSNEPFERALKRFTKSCEKNGIISDVKKRQRFEKPSEEKKRIEEAIAYIDWKQGFYDDVLSGKTKYFSNLIIAED